LGWDEQKQKKTETYEGDVDMNEFERPSEKERLSKTLSNQSGKKEKNPDVLSVCVCVCVYLRLAYG